MKKNDKLNLYKPEGLGAPQTSFFMRLISNLPFWVFTTAIIIAMLKINLINSRDELIAKTILAHESFSAPLEISFTDSSGSIVLLCLYGVFAILVIVVIVKEWSYAGKDRLFNLIMFSVIGLSYIMSPSLTMSKNNVIYELTSTLYLTEVDKSELKEGIFTGYTDEGKFEGKITETEGFLTNSFVITMPKTLDQKLELAKEIEKDNKAKEKNN